MQKKKKSIPIFPHSPLQAYTSDDSLGQHTAGTPWQPLIYASMITNRSIKEWILVVTITYAYAPTQYTSLFLNGTVFWPWG
jgi:hypothetical protein